MSDDLQTQWLNQFLGMIKFAQENNFLDEDGGIGFCGSSGAEKISFQFKIEPTNIIPFPKKEQKK